MIYAFSKAFIPKMSIFSILSKPQPNLNLTSTQRLDFTRKWLYNHHPSPTHPPTQTQSQQYLSCYWPDFDETLKVGSWEHLEQIPTVSDICPGNICPGNICPYQEYLSWYLLDFDQTFLTQFLGALIFVDHIFFVQNFFRPKYFFNTNIILAKHFLNQFVLPKFFWTCFFLLKIFCTQNLLDSNFWT